MPIYEFECDACGRRFDALVDAGTETEACRACEAPGARRVFSAQAAPFGLVMSPGDARRQEARNAGLRKQAKADFKTSRRRAREARRPRGGDGG